MSEETEPDRAGIQGCRHGSLFDAPGRIYRALWRCSVRGEGMTSHAVSCKKTGEPLAMKIDGGLCACPSADQCRMHPDPPSAQLGEMHAASFATDPKHLGFVLARYKHVSRWLVGMDRVLEVGC